MVKISHKSIVIGNFFILSFWNLKYRISYKFNLYFYRAVD